MDIDIELVKIPGGEFIMGSPESELYRSSHKTQHTVHVSSFLMGKYPVTQAQWKAVAALPQIERELDPDPSHFKGENRPVESVSWYDAAEFCRRLSAHTGRTYRLPSEAEWEYACRAGTTTPFYFGRTLTTDLANYDGTHTYGRGPKGEYREQTTEVGSFPANAFGLCDMHGNVWEWCEDRWHDSYEGAPTDGSAWLSDGDEERVLRGGSWPDLSRSCRSASRGGLRPDNDGFDLGFRVICEELIMDEQQTETLYSYPPEFYLHCSENEIPASVFVEEHEAIYDRWKKKNLLDRVYDALNAEYLAFSTEDLNMVFSSDLYKKICCPIKNYHAFSDGDRHLYYAFTETKIAYLILQFLRMSK